MVVEPTAVPINLGDKPAMKDTYDVPATTALGRLCKALNSPIQTNVVQQQTMDNTGGTDANQ